MQEKFKEFNFFMKNFDNKFKFDSLLSVDVIKRIDKIMSTPYEKLKLNFNDKIERSFPSEEMNIKSGWYKFMLLRYVLSTKFTKNKIVLDSCAGLGWGSYLLASNSRKVYANDYNKESINFINDYWKEPKIRTIFGNVLNLELPEKVDVVVAMESIEHFNKNEGIKYLRNLIKYMNKDGILIGSSVFQLSRKNADVLCSRNPYHKYIYTLSEIKVLLKKYFKYVDILENKFFICKELI